MKLYKVMSVPELLYGSETWTMRKKAEETLQSNEMNIFYVQWRAIN